ncbi:stage II sporulation protein E [Tissierella sp.]|uniref:stage II sporulation protein E n=1 Tax=Tissierella sp. TaxID=41274 RepID=UPI002861CB2B|nr:stage II sporulation protein E [Tissierella sp.]MDR7855678.1 stage II sporulation protein E [Tissierella sp.]
MMRTESLRTKRNWYDLGIRLNSNAIIILLMGFFLARTNILNKLTPFGFAFLLAYIVMKGVKVSLLLSVLIGTFTFQGLAGVSYGISCILVFSFFALIKEEKTYSLVKSILIGTSIFIISRSFGLIMEKTFFIYDLFLIIFEGIVVFTMSYVFSFSLPIERVSSTSINNEKTISSFITLALALSGISNMGILGVGIKNAVSVIIILFLGYNQGALFGGTSGMILGMVSYISNPEMPFIIGIFGIAGLLAGVFRDLGKSGSALGFFLGNGIMSFYINGLGTSFLSYREIIISTLIFFLVSNKTNSKISNIFTLDSSIKKDYSLKRDEIVVKKLNRMVELFENLSATFKESAQERDCHSAKQVYSLVDGIVNGICNKCPRYNICWEKNYYNTYQNFFNLVGKVEIKGIDNESVLLGAKKFCIKDEEIIDIIDRAVEKLKLTQTWEVKLKENRLLMSEQLEGISKVIGNMTTDIYSNPIFNKDLEQTLYKDLKNKRIDVRDVSVAQIGQEDFDIFIDLNTSMLEENKLKSIVSESLKFPVVGDNYLVNQGSQVKRFKLLRHNRFSAMTKIASAANSENKISGDSYTYGEIENTHFSALSDGMGIGRKAKEESKVAIALLERLMEANIDKNLTLKTINSVLRAKSNEEIFTTLDLAFIDLYSGKLQMIKTGAPSTFIRKKDRVEIISSRTLPVGLLKDIEFNIYEEYVEDGDIIVMVSDGILDANRDIANQEAWMKDFIMNIDSINPQTIANMIIKESQNTLSNTKDDMTVLVTKVWKNV